MKRVIGVFLLYLLLNFLYLLVVGYSTIDYMTWNNITGIFVLVVHLLGIFLTIIITKDEFENINKRFITRLIVGLFYLVMLYIFIEYQVFMLK